MTIERHLYPADTPRVHFKKHHKIWQGHKIGEASTIYVEARCAAEAEKKIKTILSALGIDVSDDMKLEMRMLPLAVLKGEPPLNIKSL